MPKRLVACNSSPFIVHARAMRLSAAAVCHVVMCLTLLLSSTAAEDNHQPQQPQQPQHELPRFDGHPDCMDLEGLQKAVSKAVWERPNRPGDDNKQLRVVILSVCDRHCLERLFPLWINSIRFAKGGDLSKHVVVVALGESAYKLCEHQSHEYGHQCVMDRACGYPDHVHNIGVSHPHHQTPEAINFGSTGYKLAMMSKLWWARQMLVLDTAVLWMDMDIIVYQALLPRLVTGTVYDSDFTIADEECTAFKQLGSEFDAWETSPQKYNWNENGGLWLVRPTQAGRGLMDVWASDFAKSAAQYEHVLDQFTLRVILNCNVTSSPVYKMNGQGGYDQITEDASGATIPYWTRPLDGKWHKLNQAWYQSQCPGFCGCVHEEMTKDDYKQSHMAKCPVPQENLDRWVTMHMNCVSGSSRKHGLMKALINMSNKGWRDPARTTISADNPAASMHRKQA